MKFFSMIIIIALLGYSYIALRLFKSGRGRAFLFIPFAFLIAFPFFRESPLMANFAFLAMGFLTYLFVLTILRDIIFKILKRTPVGPLPVIVVAILAVGLGTLKARYGVTVVHVKVPVKDLPSELVGLKIVQISDLHIGPTIGKKFVEEVVSTVNGLKADLVTFTGDIGDARVENHDEDAAPLGRLQSTYGSFYVPGNHEVYWNAESWMNKFSSLGMNVLVNRGVTFEHKGKTIMVAGVPDPRSGLKWETKAPLMAHRNSSFKILLSHRPEVAEENDVSEYQLILAGHTHGGQFFPWTLIAWLDHRYYTGLYELKSGHIYVNPGTGSWGPLLRLGTTPEITLMELIRAQ